MADERARRISDIYRLADLELAEINRQNGGPLTPEAERAVRDALSNAFKMGQQEASVPTQERDELRAKLDGIKKDYRALLKRVSDMRRE